MQCSPFILEMIQIYGNIFEKVVPQQPLPFRNKHEIFIFPPNGKLHTFDGNNWYFNQIEVIPIRPIYRRMLLKLLWIRL